MGDGWVGRQDWPQLWAMAGWGAKMLANFADINTRGDVLISQSSEAFLRRGNCLRIFRKQFYDGEIARELFANSFTTGKLLANFSQTVLRRGNCSRTFRKLFYDGEQTLSALKGTSPVKGEEGHHNSIYPSPLRGRSSQA